MTFQLNNKKFWRCDYCDRDKDFLLTIYPDHKKPPYELLEIKEMCIECIKQECIKQQNENK
jgi:hypothetical protein